MTIRDSGPAPSEPVRVRVLGALSCPRLGFTDPLFIATQLGRMNIDLRKHSGAYWEQSLSGHLYAAVDEGYDLVLVSDYDSVWRPSDVWYMLNLIVNKPEADAVFPVQYRREADQLLVGMDEGSKGTINVGQFLNEHLKPAFLGHFGLTFIRVSALKKMAHPWLWSQPGKNGRWDDPDKMDADIYFWNKFAASGNQAYCATRCVIGHIQQTITWPGDNYLPVHQYMGKYFEDGDAPPAVISAAKERALNGNANDGVS